MEAEYKEITEQIKVFLAPVSKGLDELKDTVEKLHINVHKIEIRQAKMQAGFALNKWLFGLFAAQIVVMIIGIVKAY